ncbi:MAG: hypothetical protein ACR5LC_04995 [Symbiopectobacterium sp.]|uniref:phage tail fiber protein n=1 Tax=Symbiopectobacterium sp. TaxID=2952789 RepID=UPI003F3DBB58
MADINHLCGLPNTVFDDSNVATGTVGRTFRITNNTGILRIFRDPSLLSTTGRTYISFPTAATGTALVSGNNADDGSEQINPYGSIVIRTYHRPHPDAPAFARNEIEGYANGDSIDIPRDTFISVRVQKPKVMHISTFPVAVRSLHSDLH